MNTEFEIQGYEMPPNSTALEQQMAEVRISVGKMADALTKLAILEERHQATIARVAKMEDRIIDVAKKSNDMELAQVRHFATLDGITSTIRVLWVVVGTTSITFIGKFVMSFLHVGAI
ncbi:hypothetical protein QN372_00545 [Undibacterium sp. RTI2.1]|uniref:hypothetical protein n=1 Tax=unclassified Undibacterium TaxID=2630295 RepID=UPI002AB3E174|nr:MULTISPECIES: hypothetical protein [unclassified Undibacterium]MDY7537627.1 hypothetical protein [Undibacterium sp. 5I1]MEB0029228.1 hypothetical protein [Undibacterium sp. RTI2.1]MEB0115536.1 hypothetical protein [Undibacterium sp. RTI2.2]MEB0230172.1 hypothetical protein [Undibacterium sp. 10I3]MEB0256364.1 hypothetical protein [Undibacterium sp. 5I1]